MALAPAKWHVPLRALHQQTRLLVKATWQMCAQGNQVQSRMWVRVALCELPSDGKPRGHQAHASVAGLGSFGHGQGLSGLVRCLKHLFEHESHA